MENVTRHTFVARNLLLFLALGKSCAMASFFVLLLSLWMEMCGQLSERERVCNAIMMYYGNVVYGRSTGIIAADFL